MDCWVFCNVNLWIYFFIILLRRLFFNLILIIFIKMNKKPIKNKYNKKDLERESFFYVPLTSSQNTIGNNTLSFDTEFDSDHTEFPNNKYKFISKIDDGSASKLYLASIIDTNEKVVIKKIKKNEEWKSELHILQLLKDSSPLILNLVDFYESFRSAYIVTTLYKGFDLYEHVEINVPYDIISAKKIIKNMLQCLKVCHDRNIAHLDIKCENFIVKENCNDENNLVLIDFGHSQLLDKDEIQYRSQYGTLYYICPEGFDGYYSLKSDIWSIGICLHFILRGDFPFYGYEDDEYEESVRKREMRISSRIKGQEKEFIEYCLTYNPIHRPNIQQLLEHPFLN